MQVGRGWVEHERGGLLRRRARGAGAAGAWRPWAGDGTLRMRAGSSRGNPSGSTHLRCSCWIGLHSCLHLASTTCGASLRESGCCCKSRVAGWAGVWAHEEAAPCLLRLHPREPSKGTVPRPPVQASGCRPR